MSTSRTTIIRPFLMGVGGMALSYSAMMASAPKTMAVATGVVYFIMGIVLGRLQPRSWRYAPLILVAPLALVFIPMGIQVYLFFFPVAAALGAAYLGTIAGAYWQRRLGSIASDPDAAKRRQEQFRDFSNRFLLPLSLGFAGMFLSMFSLFFGFMLGLEFPLYVVAYPLIYAAMGALLGMKNPHWLSTAFLLCLLPLLYWVVLQPLKHGLDFQTGGWEGHTAMLFVMLATFLLTALAGYAAARRAGRALPMP